MRRHLALLLFLAPGCLYGWDAYPADITQQAAPVVSNSLDHLEPVDRKIPESPYLLEYIREPAVGFQYTHLTLTRDDASGKFFVRTWSEWKNEAQAQTLNEALGPSSKAELPFDIATNVYSMWVNALLEVRYDRLGPSGPGETTDLFSAYIKGRGYLHGLALSPTKDLPPKWMEDSATALIQFTKDKDEMACRQTLLSLRDKLFAYLGTNGKH